MDDFIALKIVREGLSSRLLVLMLANRYRCRLSVRSIEEGFGFIEKEILLGSKRSFLRVA